MILRRLKHQSEAPDLPEGVSLPLKTVQEFAEKAHDQAFRTAMISLIAFNMQLKRLSVTLFDQTISRY
jgi:putative hemolysin